MTKRRRASSRSPRRAPPKKRAKRAAPRTERSARSPRTGETTRRRRPRTVVEQRGNGRLVFGAVLCGLMFAGGIVLGERNKKKSIVDTVPETAEALLASADDAANEYKQMKEKLQLTFHNELTRIAETATIPVATTTRKNEPAPHTKPAPKPVAKKTAKPAAKPAAAQPVKKAVKAVEKKATPPPVKIAKAPARDERATSTSKTPDLRALIAQKAAAEKAAPAETAAPGVPHFVQVASSPDKARAQALVEKIAASGVKAHLSAVTLDSGTEVYRIVTAPVPSREAADALRDKIKASVGLSGLVRRAK